MIKHIFITVLASAFVWVSAAGASATHSRGNWHKRNSTARKIRKARYLVRHPAASRGRRTSRSRIRLTPAAIPLRERRAARFGLTISVDRSCHIPAAMTWSHSIRRRIGVIMRMVKRTAVLDFYELVLALVLFASPWLFAFADGVAEQMTGSARSRLP